MSSSECLFCREPGGEELWRDALCRVVWPREVEHPGLCRVVLHAHVKEMTDLTADQRQRLMQVVFGLEQALRDILLPDKINLASLGNVVPHLHWHVIPRYRSDPHFPGSVWSVRLRDAAAALPLNFSDQLRRRLTRAFPD